MIAVGAHPTSLSVLNQASTMVTEQWAEGSWEYPVSQTLPDGLSFFGPEAVSVCSLL